MGTEYKVNPWGSPKARYTYCHGAFSCSRPWPFKYPLCYTCVHEGCIFYTCVPGINYNLSPVCYTYVVEMGPRSHCCYCVHGCMLLVQLFVNASPSAIPKASVAPLECHLLRFLEVAWNPNLVLHKTSAS